MIETIGNQEVFVRNYKSNFDVKQFIQEVLIPRAFPNIPINALNLGWSGITSELIAQAIEDSYYTSSMMLNESFITRSVLPSSIYSEASLFNLGYTFAQPSRCQFAVQLWIPDILKHSQQVRNSRTRRYMLDKNTRVVLGDNTYRFDYDIVIDHQLIDGRPVYNVYYDMENINSISIVTNRHIKHQISRAGWLVLFVELQEFERKVLEEAITDNLIVTNSDIVLRWYRQIAGLDLVYITPRGERVPMMKKIRWTAPEHTPFAYYSFFNDNTINLSFSQNRGFFRPLFNSKIEATIYTCRGVAANFESYDAEQEVPVYRLADRFEYNARTQAIARCYTGSTLGADKGDIELLRDDVILAHNTAHVLSTDHDLRLWFNNFARRHNNKAYFFKRRDDPTGRLFSQFIAIANNTEVHPTNTLTTHVQHRFIQENHPDNILQFDFVNTDPNTGLDKEYIIKPGHLWEYVDERVTMSDDPVYNDQGHEVYRHGDWTRVLLDYWNRISQFLELDPEHDYSELELINLIKDYIVAGCICQSGVRYIKFNGNRILFHRNGTDIEFYVWCRSRDTIKMVPAAVQPRSITEDNGGVPIYLPGTDPPIESVHATRMAFISDDVLPQITEDRPFMFVNPFYIKLHRFPGMSSNYNYLIDNTSWPEEVPIQTGIFLQFQAGSMNVMRSLSRQYHNQYRFKIQIAPVTPRSTISDNFHYVDYNNIYYGQDNYDPADNNLRVVMVTRNRIDGETGYIEMMPVKITEGGSITFETSVTVADNLRSDLMLEIPIHRHELTPGDPLDDCPNPGMNSLITHGERAGSVFIDSSETSVHFIILVRPLGDDVTSGSYLFGDNRFKDFHMANRFANQHRELTLYKPLTMMRSVLTFGIDTETEITSVEASLVPFLKWDTPLNEEKMNFFIQNFTEQYNAIEPVLRRLDNNCFIDLKLFNTYGRSNNYYIGPKPESDVLWDSDILLDNVHVKIRFRLAVHDRTAYVQTAEAVTQEIKSFFETLSTGELRDIHISNLIRLIEQNHPNVKYIRFLGINEYDANKQSIFVKYEDISDLQENELKPYVPEMIQVGTIELKEEN